MIKYTVWRGQIFISYTYNTWQNICSAPLLYKLILKWNKRVHTSRKVSWTIDDTRAMPYDEEEAISRDDAMEILHSKLHLCSGKRKQISTITANQFCQGIQQ